MGERMFARWRGGHGGSAEPPPSLYMYMCCSVCSFLLVASLSQGREAEGGGGLLCLWSPWLRGLCVYTFPFPSMASMLIGSGWRWASGYKFLVPPSSLLRLNPSVLYTERRRPPSVPFSGHLSVRSCHAAPADDCGWEECNRLGSVFVDLLCVSRRDVLSVADVCVTATCYSCLHNGSSSEESDKRYW